MMDPSCLVDHSISNRVIHWIDFYPVDNAIQRLNNRGLVAKLKVNHRGSSNRLWSNLIAIRVDTQLKNGFGVQLLSRQRVLKTTELQEQYKKHVTTSRDVVYLVRVILVSKLFL